MGARLKDPVRNFWSKVDVTGGCWLWKAGLDKDGYGKFAIGLGGHAQIHTRAHRFAFETFVGDIPEDMVVCHHCDNPPCVNLVEWALRRHEDDPDTPWEDFKRRFPVYPMGASCWSDRDRNGSCYCGKLRTAEADAQMRAGGAGRGVVR